MAQHGDFKKLLLGDKSRGDSHEAQNQGYIEHPLMIADKTDVAILRQVFASIHLDRTACGKQSSPGPKTNYFLHQAMVDLFGSDQLQQGIRLFSLSFTS
jgi:hypothetical protein